MNDIQQRIAEDRAAYVAVFTSAAGRRVLKDIYRLAFTVRIDKDDPNPDAAVFMAGQMTLVQTIMNKAGLAHADMMEAQP